MLMRYDANTRNPQLTKMSCISSVMTGKALGFWFTGCSFLLPTFFHGTGQDFDMTEFEVLGLDQWDSEEFLPHTASTSGSESTPMTPTMIPQSTPPSAPSLPPTPVAREQPEEVREEVQAASSSPQLRLTKRKAPEVYCLVNVAAQLLSDPNCPLRVVIYSLIH